MTDCPPNYDNAASWWASIRAWLPVGFDAYEVMNECPPPAEGWERLATWSIDMAQIVARERQAALLAFSFAPGNPIYPAWPHLVGYLEWVAEHPLRDGRYHGIALHAAANATWSRADAPWINNPHLTIDRWYLFARDVLLANTGFDAQTWPGLVTFTELGVTDGYAGTWDIAFTCAEKADAWQETTRRLQERGGLMAWWNLGAIGKWTSDHDCLRAMVG